LPSENAPAPEKPVVMAQVGLAVHAVAGFIFGAVALFYRFALFNQADARAGSFAAFAQQFQCGKNTGRAGANDNQIIIVHVG